MSLRRSGAALLLTGVLAWSAAACAPAAEALTDPREILARTIATGASLRTATVRLEVRSRDAANPRPPDGGILDAQIDFGNREVNARLVGADGAEQFRLLVADGLVFGSTGGQARWQPVPIEPAMLADPGALFLFGRAGQAPPDHAAILAAAAADPQIRVALAGTEDCGDRRCYRVDVEIPREAVWPLTMRLAGIDRVPGDPVPQPPVEDLPIARLSVLSDVDTLQPIDVTLNATVDTTTIDARLQVTLHNASLSIAPPPAELVDDTGQPGFGGGQATPVPAEPPLSP